jgi:hypothetical protein
VAQEDDMAIPAGLQKVITDIVCKDGYDSVEEWVEAEYVVMQQWLNLWLCAKNKDDATKLYEKYTEAFDVLARVIGGKIILDRLIEEKKLVMGG